MNNPMGSTRGSWNGVNPVTRMTPTKKGKQKRIENKHKGRRFEDYRYII